MSRYHDNKARARTVNTDPTETDQAAATDTDINVIVAKYAVQGAAPGAKQEPLSGDFTNTPNDLRGMIEAARAMKSHHAALPPELKGIPINALLTMTPAEVAAKLKKEDTPAPTPEPTEKK